MKKNVFLQGIRDGIPIGLGYFAVAFSLGIVAQNAGLSAFQGFVASFFNVASAGEYALFTAIKEGVTYLEVALITFIVNARYLLMSCALSQRFNPETKFKRHFYELLEKYPTVNVGFMGFPENWNEIPIWKK